MKTPHLIERDAVYDVESARSALQLKKTTLAREFRLGRLRYAKRAGRYFILGQWLLDWLAEGEPYGGKRAGSPDRSAGDLEASTDFDDSTLDDNRD